MASSLVALAIVSCYLIQSVITNTPLPDGWRPLPNGQCTIQGPTPSIYTAIARISIGFEEIELCQFDQFDNNGLFSFKNLQF